MDEAISQNLAYSYAASFFFFSWVSNYTDPQYICFWIGNAPALINN